MVLVLLVGSVVSCSCRTEAQEVVPCLIVSGKAGSEQHFDLSKLNRISFGEEGIIVSSSKDNAVADVKLPYSLYHHLEVDEALPTITGIDQNEIAQEPRLLFDAVNKSLHLYSEPENEFKINIFNLKGALLGNAILKGGQSLSLETFPSGLYIAVGSCNENSLSLKFIIN